MVEFARMRTDIPVKKVSLADIQEHLDKLETTLGRLEEQVTQLANLTFPKTLDIKSTQEVQLLEARTFRLAENLNQIGWGLWAEIACRQRMLDFQRRQEKVQAFQDKLNA